MKKFIIEVIVTEENKAYYGNSRHFMKGGVFMTKVMGEAWMFDTEEEAKSYLAKSGLVESMFKITPIKPKKSV